MDQEWQAIETAPKDGTNIIVLYDFASVAIAHIAWYRSKEEYREYIEYNDGGESMEDFVGWWSYVENSVSQWKLDEERQPLYWMPCPKFPDGVG